MFAIRLDGVDALAAKLRALPEALTQATLDAALTAAAEPLRAHAASLAPRDSGDLAANIVIAPLTGEALGSDDAGVAVGPEHHPDDLFYGYFQEFGTEHHGAQPFLRPAFDAEAPRVLKTLTDHLWQAIHKRTLR